MKYLALLLAAFACFSVQLAAQTNYPLFYDKNQTMEFGASNALVVHRAMYSLEDKYIPLSLWKEEKLVTQSLGFGYRMSKLMLFDIQQDIFLSLVMHEVFGHGARYREFGSRDNNYTLNLFYPYGKGNGSAFPGNIYRTTPHKTIAASMGGVEANQVLANSLTPQILLSDKIHYRQATMLLVSQYDQFMYVMGDRFPIGPFGGGDMEGYVNKLNNLYATPDKEFTLGRFARQQLISLANPMQLYSAFTILYNYGVKGEQYMPTIPMIPIGKVRYLPMLSLNLSPFGNEYVLSNNVRAKNRLFVGDIGISDHYFNNFYRVRLKAFNAVTYKKLRMNYHLSVWSQPELQLEPTNDPSETKVGGMVKADVIFNPLVDRPEFGFFTQVGYKTKGFEIGAPLDQGGILKYGLNFSF